MVRDYSLGVSITYGSPETAGHDCCEPAAVGYSRLFSRTALRNAFHALQVTSVDLLWRSLGALLLHLRIEFPMKLQDFLNEK